MKIKSLQLKQYRNISRIHFDFHPHLNIFVGENGVGKTNILESIVYLSSGRSFRVNQDSYLIQEKQDFAMIEAAIENNNNLKVVLSEKGKYLTHNQRVIEKLSDFIGICNVVLFNPDDLQFFATTPRKRRREIDYELGKHSHDYLRKLSVVNQLIADRNAFLKKNEKDDLYLEVIDENLIDLSVDIIKERAAFIEKITKRTQATFNHLTDMSWNLVIDYQASIDLSESDYQDALKKKMKDSLRRDKEFKLTHVGIHRDDYIFKIDQIPVVNILSQGQKRLLMIAFKIAILNWLIQENQIIPIFCMDDLFSELDYEKRKAVLALLDPSIQVFITTTDLNFIETNKDKRIFKIKKDEGGVIYE